MLHVQLHLRHPQPLQRRATGVHDRCGGEAPRQRRALGRNLERPSRHACAAHELASELLAQAETIHLRCIDEGEPCRGELVESCLGVVLAVFFSPVAARKRVTSASRQRHQVRSNAHAVCAATQVRATTPRVCAATSRAPRHVVFAQARRRAPAAVAPAPRADAYRRYAYCVRARLRRVGRGKALADAATWRLCAARCDAGGACRVPRTLALAQLHGLVLRRRGAGANGEPLRTRHVRAPAAPQRRSGDRAHTRGGLARGCTRRALHAVERDVSAASSAQLDTSSSLPSTEQARHTDSRWGTWPPAQGRGVRAGARLRENRHHNRALQRIAYWTRRCAHLSPMSFFI